MTGCCGICPNKCRITAADEAVETATGAHMTPYYSDDRAGVSDDYCGCCGNAIDGADRNWCLRCVQHVGHTTSMHLRDRTYLALNSVTCPFQVGCEVVR